MAVALTYRVNRIGFTTAATTVGATNLVFRKRAASLPSTALAGAPSLSFRQKRLQTSSAINLGLLYKPGRFFLVF